MNCFRIHYRHAFLSRKPESTVTGLDPGGQPRAIAFNIKHAVALPEGNAVDSFHSAVGEIIQVLTTNAIDATVATDPKVTSPVFQN
jgi:hypothetical protein